MIFGDIAPVFLCPPTSLGHCVKRCTVGSPIRFCAKNCGYWPVSPAPIRQDGPRRHRTWPPSSTGRGPVEQDRGLDLHTRMVGPAGERRRRGTFHRTTFPAVREIGRAHV